MLPLLLSFLFFPTAHTTPQTIPEHLSQIPACGLPCLETAISKSSCGGDDYHCICSTGLGTVLDLSYPCIVRSCSSDDIYGLGNATARLCDAALGISNFNFTTNATTTATPTTTSSIPSSQMSVSTVVASDTVKGSSGTPTPGSPSSKSGVRSTFVASRAGWTALVVFLAMEIWYLV